MGRITALTLCPCSCHLLLKKNLHRCDESQDLNMGNLLWMTHLKYYCKHVFLYIKKKLEGVRHVHKMEAGNRVPWQNLRKPRHHQKLKGQETFLPELLQGTALQIGSSAEWYWFWTWSFQNSYRINVSCLITTLVVIYYSNYAIEMNSTCFIYFLKTDY